MLLTPQYGDQPIISIALRSGGAHPLLAQRRRLEAQLLELTDEQWRHASRCDGWSVQDVIIHLASTNAFWAMSIDHGLAGDPTRFLAAFDPVASPAELVDRAQGTPASVTLAEFVASNEALARSVDALDDAGWDMTAEAPPGHLPIRLVADHALWDAWVHERDIMLPLGLELVVDADEVRTCLHYAATLGLAFALVSGAPALGAVEVAVTAPDDHFVVQVASEQVLVHDDGVPAGARLVEADAVELLEALSRRDIGRPEPPAVAWLSAGLAAVFDQPSPV